MFGKYLVIKMTNYQSFLHLYHIIICKRQLAFARVANYSATSGGMLAAL